MNASRSVMRYGDREGPANYSHPDFVPLFLDEQPEEVRQEAEELCGDGDLACVFDFIATRSAAFANATRLTKDTVDTEEQQSSMLSMMMMMMMNGKMMVMTTMTMTMTAMMITMIMTVIRSLTMTNDKYNEDYDCDDGGCDYDDNGRNADYLVTLTWAA